MPLPGSKEGEEEDEEELREKVEEGKDPLHDGEKNPLRPHEGVAPVRGGFRLELAPGTEPRVKEREQGQYGEEEEEGCPGDGAFEGRGEVPPREDVEALDEGEARSNPRLNLLPGWR